MATSEIEKLERRYAENPHGLTFAPLAEVHRKNGDVARALELLTAGLELHPNYIPASIVLGRCHQDLADLPSAEAAFAHVLRLDDENVIALKSLADINERQERLGEAETWLRRLVSVDRSNDEAWEQLRRIETAKQGEQSEPAAQGEQGSHAEADVAPTLEMIDLTPETVPQSPEPSSSPAELVEAAAAAEGQEPVTSVEASRPKVEEPASQEETVQPLPGLISAEFQPPLEATGGLGVETSEEVVLEVSGESEFRVPDASEDLRSLVARLNSPPPAAPPAERQQAATPGPESGSKPATELEFVALEAGSEESDPAVTEEPAKRPSYVAADTKGQSVAAFFRAIVAARPPSGPVPSGGASASHAGSAAPARDGAALDRSEEGPVVPPAVPTGEPKADGAVSFDDFFNPEGDGSTPLRRGSSDPGEDDLDQFQSWLQNLKR